MPKFFVDPSKITDDRIIIDTEDVAHITKALRNREGDVITIGDGHGYDYECRIAEITKREILCDVIAKKENLAEPTVFVTLCLALPKGDKADFVIQKAVELGVSRIVMFEGENSVARAASDERGVSKKLSKWQKTALEASKQCGRGVIPEVVGIYSFEQAVDIAKESDRALFLYEKAENGKLSEISWDGISSASYFIGPEGGFSEEEADYAIKSGIHAITLGERILRLETAAISAAAIIMHITHNL